MQEYTVDTYLRTFWKDERLVPILESIMGFNHTHDVSDDYVVFDADIMQYFWRPDVYFSNAKEARIHDVSILSYICSKFDSYGLIDFFREMFYFRGHPNRPNAIRPKAIGPKEKMPRASKTMLLGEVNASKHCWR